MRRFPSERVITPVQVWSGKHLINKLDPIRWNESYLLMPCSPRRSKACLWGNPKGMKCKHAIRGAAKEWTTQNKTTHIKKEKRNDCSTQQCQRLWFSQAIHHAILINSWHWFSVERFLLWFHTRFYQNYYGLCWINQRDQSARDAKKKENVSLSSEVALLIKVQSHSQKLQLSHSIQTCQVGLS